MRSLAATLVALFGLNVIWGASSYVFDAKPTDGATPYYWAIATVAFGGLIIGFSKSLAKWVAEGLDESRGELPASLRLTLIRLMGIYVLYYQVPILAQWFFVLTGLDPAATYASVAPEFSNHAKWKLFIHIALVAGGLALTLAPRRVEAWCDKFDLK